MKVKMCRIHNPSKLGYVEQSLWAEAKVRRGHKQRQCPKCKLWFFKGELKKEGKK